MEGYQFEIRLDGEWVRCWLIFSTTKKAFRSGMNMLADLRGVAISQNVRVKEYRECGAHVGGLNEDEIPF